MATTKGILQGGPHDSEQVEIETGDSLIPPKYKSVGASEVYQLSEFTDDEGRACYLYLGKGERNVETERFVLRGLAVPIYTFGDGKRYIDEGFQGRLNQMFKDEPPTTEELKVINALKVYVLEAHR